MLKRLIFGLATLFFCAAAAAQKPTEGVEYLSLNPPQSTDAPGKVEVVEFFWYRCPHCYSLEPVIEDWLKKLPRDVQFRRVPAIFDNEWALDARIFYTLEATGDLARVHKGLFNAIHREGGVRQRGDAYMKWVADWLAKQGVDMAKYNAALRSFTVENKLKRSLQMTQAYKLDGVPAIGVQGRWVVSATANSERLGMMNVTDYLVGEARKRMK